MNSKAAVACWKVGCVSVRRGFFVCLACIFLSGLASTPSEGNDWIAAGSDNLWSNADNWSQGVVPLNATSHPGFGWDDPNGPFYPLTPDTSDDGPLWNNDALLTAEGATILVDSTVAATAYGVRIGFEGASNTLEMTRSRWSSPRMVGAQLRE